jgi:hypothetical protein
LLKCGRCFENLKPFDLLSGKDKSKRRRCNNDKKEIKKQKVSQSKTRKEKVRKVKNEAPIKHSKQDAQNKRVNKIETNCVDLVKQRNRYFDSVLEKLNECTSYTTLKRKRQDIDYGNYNIIPQCVTMAQVLI